MKRTSYRAPSGRLHRLKRRCAFTLVEVALSLGIVAITFVPMLGLLPAGLGISREAIDTTVEAQIVQALTAEVLQTDFSGLKTLADQSVNSPYYFDEHGTLTSSSSNRIYKAIYSVSTNTSLPSQVSSQKLAVVTICILNTTANRRDRTEADLSKNADSSKYCVLVPDNGR